MAPDNVLVKPKHFTRSSRPFGIQPSLTLQPPLPTFPASQAHWSCGSSLCFCMPPCFCTCYSLSLQFPSLFFSGETPAHSSRPGSNVTFCASPRHIAALAPACCINICFHSLSPPQKIHFTSKSNAHTHTRCKSFQTVISHATCYAH